ncbi:MAG: hypothetical protein LBB12_02925 [Holosporaceae bacterium]|nr:hypothetical protein [Holosporaceae bacterium]
MGSGINMGNKLQNKDVPEPVVVRTSQSPWWLGRPKIRGGEDVPEPVVVRTFQNPWW